MKTEFKLVRIKDVMQITTLSKSTIYRRVKEKSLAAPLNLGGKVSAWRLTDVEDFIAQGLNHQSKSSK